MLKIVEMIIWIVVITLQVIGFIRDKKNIKRGIVDSLQMLFLLALIWINKIY